jgi:hypothetical protein
MPLVHKRQRDPVLDNNYTTPKQAESTSHDWISELMQLEFDSAQLPASMDGFEVCAQLPSRPILHDFHAGLIKLLA